MTITKELARRFCAAFNAATDYQIIGVLADGTVAIVPPHPDDCGRDDCWMEFTKGLYPNVGDSTESAYKFLLDCHTQAIRQLNNLQTTNEF